MHVTSYSFIEDTQQLWECQEFRDKQSASISKAKVEKVKDPEYRKSLSTALKKAWSVPKYKILRDKIAHERSKSFELISPIGEIHRGKNIRQFCKDIFDKKV